MSDQPQQQLAVTVYTTAACSGCTLTKKHLDRRGIAYTEVEIDHADETLMAAFDELGHRSAPVVVASTPDGDRDWSGYRPDSIDGLRRYLTTNGHALAST